ncbi:MAG: hypothetical protein A4E57_04844 [Syntrophorhabdaceae bacterium PtaU1.Bin034]|nr:MAG: hypothetical protein A4E57_04844 [Syntrophorhabdaceae bacterium PtaU1.Bin034]
MVEVTRSDNLGPGSELGNGPCNTPVDKGQSAERYQRRQSKQQERKQVCPPSIRVSFSLAHIEEPERVGRDVAGADQDQAGKPVQLFLIHFLARGCLFAFDPFRKQDFHVAQVFSDSSQHLILLVVLEVGAHYMGKHGIIHGVPLGSCPVFFVEEVIVRTLGQIKDIGEE